MWQAAKAERQKYFAHDDRKSQSRLTAHLAHMLYLFISNDTAKQTITIHHHIHVEATNHGPKTVQNLASLLDIYGPCVLVTVL